MLVGARMVQDLNHYSNPPAMTREKVLAKLGPELTADLYVNSSWRDRPPTEKRRIDDEPATKSDDDDDDDEEVDPDGGNNRITSLSPSTIASPATFRFHSVLARASRSFPPRLKQLGRFRSAHGFWETAALERYAPRPSDAEPVV